MIYVREVILSTLIGKSNSIERILIELNLRKKWLLCRLYDPHKSFISQHLRIISRNLDTLNDQV